MRTTLYILLLCALIVPFLVQAQNMHAMPFSGQPLMYVKDGQTTGCGIRIFGVQLNPDQTVSIVDASINIDMSGAAIVKLSSARTTMQEMKTTKRRTFNKVTDGWMKAPGSQATVPINQKTFAGEDGYSLLYITSMDSALTIHKAQSEKKNISIGIKHERDSHMTIYSGTVEMSLQEMEQMGQCLDDLIARLNRTR